MVKSVNNVIFDTSLFFVRMKDKLYRNGKNYRIEYRLIPIIYLYIK